MACHFLIVLDLMMDHYLFDECNRIALLRSVENTNQVYKMLDSHKIMFEWLKRVRKYASFFEAPNKTLNELTVSKEWLKPAVRLTDTRRSHLLLLMISGLIVK